MNCISSGERIKQYRKMLKVSQKEAAGSRLSHSMISLIESGKIQLTTVTAIILADNFNKIAAEKGINLNLSLKDMLMSKEEFIQNSIKRSFDELQNTEYDEVKYRNLYDAAGENKLFLIQGLIKETLGNYKYERGLYEDSLRDFEDSVLFFEKEENIESIIRLYYKLGLCNIKLNIESEAEIFFEKIIKYLPNNNNLNNILFDTLAQLIRIYIHKEDYNKAVYYIDNYLEPCCKTEENLHQLLKMRSYLHLKQENYDEALRLYMDLINKNKKNNHILFHNLSISLYKLGLFEQADSFARKALDYCYQLQDMRVEEKVFLLGEEYANFDLFDKAVEYFEVAINCSKKYKNELLIVKALKYIYKCLNLSNNINAFDKYIVTIIELINNTLSDAHKLEYVLLLSKYYLQIKDVEKLQILISSIDTEFNKK